jgi:divalent metal cation (Fe/Co/Zn/Cd) transporter
LKLPYHSRQHGRRLALLWLRLGVTAPSNCCQQWLYCGGFAHMHQNTRSNVLRVSQAVCYPRWLPVWSWLRPYSEPKLSYLGMAVLVGAAIIMPVLAKEKRRLLALTGSTALRADAAESALCAYLSIIALMGLAVHAIWHVAWADPVAALVITPLIAFEGREAMRGKACGCC